MREQKVGEKTRGRKRRGNVSFSRWPASSAPPPSTPPSPLGSQVAGLGTDGPPSLSMLALLALPNTKQQWWEDTSQTRYKGRMDKRCLKAWHTLTFHTTCKENRGQPGELEEAFSNQLFSKNDKCALVEHFIWFLLEQFWFWNKMHRVTFVWIIIICCYNCSTSLS